MDTQQQIDALKEVLTYDIPGNVKDMITNVVTSLELRLEDEKQGDESES